MHLPFGHSGLQGQKKANECKQASMRRHYRPSRRRPCAAIVCAIALLISQNIAPHADAESTLAPSICAAHDASAGPTHLCAAGCTHSFQFRIPDGRYVVRAKLTAEGFGDLDYGPTEHAHVFVDNTQVGGDCFGSSNEWILCATETDVTHLLASRIGGDEVIVALRSSPGVAGFAARAMLTLELSLVPWLGGVDGGTVSTIDDDCIGVDVDVVIDQTVCAYLPVAHPMTTPVIGAFAKAADPDSNDGSQLFQCVSPTIDPVHSGWQYVTVIDNRSGIAMSPPLLFYAYGAVSSASIMNADGEGLSGPPEGNTAVRFAMLVLDGDGSETGLSVHPLGTMGSFRGFQGGCTFGAVTADLVYDAMDETYACVSP
eukprot:SAG31_NODE_10489_length_1132_cov_1.424976_1_plen_370_part_10